MDAEDPQSVKLEDTKTDGMWISVDPLLESLLSRLESLSLQPGFQFQRQLALSRALHTYWSAGSSATLSPLPEELALAKLYLYADYYPEDGQFSLIEQLRDMVEVHISEEERRWLDPLRHSYLDLLEIRFIRSPMDADGMVLGSLGDGREFTIDGGTFSRPVHVGQVLLTRLLRQSEGTVLPGTAVILSLSAARSIFETTNQGRRETEAITGAFELGEWEEFAKLFGHVLLENLSQARLESLLKSETRIRFRTAGGEPCLFAMALYEHHEFKFLAHELPGVGKWESVEAELVSDRPNENRHTWVLRDDGSEGPSDEIVARMTLTPTQLQLEVDSPERLDAVKHSLAAAFGFSLHFRGETTIAPTHPIVESDIAEEDSCPSSVVVDPEEEFRILEQFLESAYLEWVDKPSPALGGKTPRHAAANAETCSRVEALIDEVEGNDLALRRTGRAGYDYHKLRTQVGVIGGKN